MLDALLHGVKASGQNAGGDLSGLDTGSVLSGLNTRSVQGLASQLIKTFFFLLLNKAMTTTGLMSGTLCSSAGVQQVHQSTGRSGPGGLVHQEVSLVHQEVSLVYQEVPLVFVVAEVGLVQEV